MIQILLLLLFVPLHLATTFNGGEDGESSLLFHYLSRDRISGEFIMDDRSVVGGGRKIGITFDSTQDSLHLTKLNKQHLLTIKSTHDNLNNHKNYDLFVLGKRYFTNYTKIAPPREEELDRMREFLSLKEVSLLRSVSEKLAAIGVKGNDLPGIMGLYKIALGTSKALHKQQQQLNPCQCDCPKVIDLKCAEQGKSIPQCCDCLGQCGACGDCWSFVCGDCCWNRGCCGHDICCYDSLSVGCLFPIDLKCDGSYTCSDYDTSCCSTPPNGAPNTCSVESFSCSCGSVCCEGGWVC